MFLDRKDASNLPLSVDSSPIGFHGRKPLLGAKDFDSIKSETKDALPLPGDGFNVTLSRP